MFQTTKSLTPQSVRRLLGPSTAAALLGAGSLMALSVHDESQQEDTKFKKTRALNGLTSNPLSLPSFPSMLQPAFTKCEKEEAMPQQEASEFEILRDMMLENPILKELKNFMKKDILETFEKLSPFEWPDVQLKGV